MHSVSLASKPIKASRFNIHRAIVDTRDFSAMACLMTDPVIPSNDENDSEIELQDGVYKQLYAVFLASGKGRRPKLPEMQLTPKLLKQMLLLKKVGEKSFDEVSSFLHEKLFPEVPFSRLRYLIMANADAQKSSHTDTGDSSSASQNLTLPIDVEILGEFLQGLTRRDILCCTDELSTSRRSPSYGLLKDLLDLKRKEGKTYSDMCEWWQRLTGDRTTEVQMTQAATKFRKKNAKLQPSAHRPQGKLIYQEFLSGSPFESPSTSLGSLSGLTPTVRSEIAQESSLVLKLAEAGKQLAAARRKDEEQSKEILDLKTKVSVLTDSCAQLQNVSARNNELHGTELKLTAKIKDLENQLEEKKAEIDHLNQRLKYSQKQGLEQKLKRRGEKVETLQAKLSKTEQQCQNAEEWRKYYRKEIRQLQQKNADVKHKLGKAQDKVKSLKEAAQNEDRQPAAEDEVFAEVNMPEIRLKDESGCFRPEARVVIMTLTGENEVPAHRCGTVINAVARHIFGCKIPEDDLPSQRSALRFVDQGHVISKAHVAEMVMNSNTWDFHTDGTSRSGQKYVCQQVTTENGSYSLGFVPVASEDTATLVDISIQMVEELAELYPADEAHENFVHMLLGLSGIMTDRAAVMKSFGRTLQEERKTLLQTDEGLEFLHCNAHFLLGLGAECKRVLAREERDGGERLGRDALSRFNSFRASECSAFRYVRMACDCLGPRGDDKNGCRDNWQAYCLMVGQKSSVTSFRENRFNNLFQAAAALHFHRQDIEDFISNYMPQINKKIDSVLADNRSEQIDCHIIALGLLYIRVTGPYWSLLGKSVKYLDFHIYVGLLYALLTSWQRDSSPAFQADFPPLFPGVNFSCDQDVLQSLMAIGEEKKEKVKVLLQNICGGLVTVTERQLADFLPGGRYCDVQDPVLRQKMKHSHITNLVSEECFADLDFSIFKRRNSSLHHHSSMNMMKRNKSMTSWFMLKSSEEQAELLQLSGKKSALLREKHRRIERDTIRRRQVILEQAHEKKQAAEEKKCQQVMAVMQDIRPHQGPCETPEDINRLLMHYGSDNARKKALRAELLFHKLVLIKKSPLLKVSGTSLVLTNRLLELLGGHAVQNLPPLRPPLQPMNWQPPQRRPRSELFENTSDSEPDFDPSDENDEEQDMGAEKQLGFENFTFKFRQTGEVVAVYFLEDFFIGEVTTIYSEDEAEVNFMTTGQAKGTSIFRWPAREDRCNISARVVFAGQLGVTPSSSSGRSFIVETPDDLRSRYEAFRVYLTENRL